jgi:squalene-associated FAD-dependent desaturase
MKRCLIIGGGIAGLNAASILTSKKIPVTLIESSPKPGGRTYSFLDKDTDTVIDNGQHIMMGCYSDTLSFVKLIGAENNFDYQKNLTLNFLHKSKKHYRLNANVYFYPVNLLYAILRYNILSTNEKFSFIGFILKLPFLSERSLRNLNVKEWLVKENQSVNAIKYFWEILCVGALNTSLEKASALIFYKILMQIFLKGNFASTIILPKHGLSESLIDSAIFFIVKNGGKIIPSETVKELIIENQKIVTVKSDTNSYNNYDFVISALPLYGLEKIIPLKALDINLEIQYSAILNIHLWISGFKFQEKFYGLLDSQLHWIFVKENHINIVISNANTMAEKSKEEIFDLVMDELEQFISINKSDVQHYKIIKGKRATFIPEIDISNRRPNSKTKIKNLFLAGDWINTGLPSTIESAAKSGRIAADLVFHEISNG